MFYPSHIELSKSALENNLGFLNEWIGRDTRFTSVIKGNAYGHGIEQFVPMAERCGVRSFAVFSVDEARRAYDVIRKNSDIMIMGMIGGDSIGWAIERELSFFVFGLNRLQSALTYASDLSVKARIHLHLETGMNRLGMHEKDLEGALKMIRRNQKYVEVEGLSTHFAGAESISNHVRIQKQIARFKNLSSEIQARGIKTRYEHTACSAAALNYPETIMDMVRFGIAQYGFWPSRETCMNFLKKHFGTNGNGQPVNNPLARVISWKSHVMSIKEVAGGEYVGYGDKYLTNRNQKIATVPVGYAHGYGRNLTNMGRVLINGKRADVAGLVNMNLLTVDVTDISDVRTGDEVVIIGQQEDREITVSSFSEMQNYLNYEVLVRLPPELPRSIVE